jgi:hypothetical protein
MTLEARDDFAKDGFTKLHLVRMIVSRALGRFEVHLPRTTGFVALLHRKLLDAFDCLLDLKWQS